ncbi:MAG TPA: hypothetical protein VK533_10845 [Sphingomonas sp.]|uniref:hypothetical protein n=1 Tax=Sphingomonas sp. TaxID=28214 RepID=UPI002BCB6782|nr:hypothetical protein [Sphingomonas sp.]HMI20032.1 hypothetical protein [Sphingomonas sp.]
MLQAAMMMAVALAGAEVGAPPPFHALPHGSQMLYLDTTPGHYSMWQTHDLDGVNAVRAHFRVRLIGQDKKWIGAFNFSLERDDRLVRVSITGIAGKPVLVVQMQDGKASAPKEDPQPGAMWIDEEADLAIDWDQSGHATFWIKSTDPNAPLAQALAMTLDLGGAPTTFSISGSTGELEVMSLALGHSG